MLKAIEIFKTLDDIKPYIGQVWEDDDGLQYELLAVKLEARSPIAYYCINTCVFMDCDFHAWLAGNTLPKELRGLDIPEGFTPWPGGDQPVNGDTNVEVIIRSGYRFHRIASLFRWHNMPEYRNGSEDIIAYRVIDKPEIPEGFTPWSGRKRPVQENTKVEVLLRSGEKSKAEAGYFTWHHMPKIANGDQDIVAYRVVEDWQIPEGFTPWSGGECPVEPDAHVDYIMRDSKEEICLNQLAEQVIWKHENQSWDIIAYRITIPESFTLWNGGECPVSVGNKVEYILRNGKRYTSVLIGETLWDRWIEAVWTHDGGYYDIIAYRVVESAASDEKPTIEIRIVERDQSYLSEIEYRYLLTTGYSDWRIAERVRLP
jgi:hypothetical protein